MTDARTEILARVRDATGTAAPVTRDYRRRGAADAQARVALFCERAGDYRATVRRVAAADLIAAIAAAFAQQDASRVVIPPGLPAAWRPPALELTEDDGLSAAELDGFDGVLSGARVAVAETGTIILAGGPSEGRRALTLVPDLHVCVLGEEQIVELVPEAIARVDGEGRPLTLISGPSATSDIELKRVEGVHGPRRLVILVVSPERPAP